ncbi:hypothetical protein [Enterobacter hormaechei]|nr:hypothetical protein [Enterobacter phage vB_ExiM_F1M1E]UNA03140.1 hypothetical protein [Enterobacter phage vB_ExiM_F2M1E]UNA03461.1 hypothetical protein [Enterobacter phage vB_ExiM_F4M1E]UNA03782.1 hypothetical protein [Enterobacter phage vB_ExiM_F5M1E]UNA04102.1 hypothetical protein [Pantoea phage vB_PdiM_F5M2A]
MKVQGALWKQFYNDEEYWKGHYHDDVLITFDGVEQEDYDNPADDAVVKVESGYVYKTDDDFPSSRHDLSLATFFRRWKKIQTTEVIVVTVDKDYADAVREEIDRLDGVKGIK